jgi:hypothetical protein
MILLLSAYLLVCPYHIQFSKIHERQPAQKRWLAASQRFRAGLAVVMRLAGTPTVKQRLGIKSDLAAENLIPSI